jgi:DNA-directed RNA polymerase specialized sigma24 family protein
LVKRLLGAEVNADAITRAVVAALKSKANGKPATALVETQTHSQAPAGRGQSASARSQPDAAGKRRAADLVAQFEQAVLRLPEIYRDVFVLADIEGIAIARTATLLTLSPSVVKVRLHRARLLMQDSLAYL